MNTKKCHVSSEKGEMRSVLNGKGKRLFDNQLVVDQSKERSAGRFKEPAQMIMAGCAEAVFPDISGKPGKLIGWLAVINTA